MSRALADTSIFIARESGRPLLEAALPAELSVSVITVAELRAGVLATSEIAVRSRRLATFTAAQALSPLPIDDAVGVEWARLRVFLRDAGRRMPVNDSWIAATAMAAGVPILTTDDDYDAAIGLDGFDVIKA